MRFKLAIFSIICFTYFYSSQVFSADCEKPKMPSKDEWQTWLMDIKDEALKLGISKEIIDSELDSISPQKKIIMRDRCQPESQITFDEYIYYRVDKHRINAGKNLLKKYHKELKLVGEHFNIQPRFIVAVLGLESFYGKNQGKIKTMEAVGTLAFDRRRSNFYKKQLFAALKIVDDNLVDSDSLIGSWGGAIGAVQMIPTTYLESGYDFDKDNKIDIWNNYLDIFASVANYLTSIDKNPWSDDSTWGREVIPPKNIKLIYDSLRQKNPKGCGAVKSRSIPKNLSEWNKLGFKKTNGDPLPLRNDLEARLVAPDGVDGSKFYLVYPNYKNILYYNCSSYYALSIGILSDEIIN